MKRISQKAPHATLLFALLIAVIVLMIMLRTCSRSHTSDLSMEASKGDTIDIAIEYGPLSLYRYADTLGGFAYDLIRHIAATDSLRVKFHPITTINQGLDGLDKGYYRLVVAALPLSKSITDRYAATIPVFLDRLVLVQATDSAGKAEVNTQLDLANKAVWVMAGSPAADRLRNLAEEIGDTIFVVENEEYGNEQLFILAVTGEIPRAVVTERTARMLARDFPTANISTAVSFTQFQSWILSKNDSATLALVDSAIVKAQSTDTYRSLSNKYLH